MKVILLEGDDAYNMLKGDIKEIVKSAMKEIVEESQKETLSSKEEELWVSTKEAMKILGIKGSAKMQEIRDNSPMNGIKISKNGRIFRYYKPSLQKFLEKNIIK